MSEKLVYERRGRGRNREGGDRPMRTKEEREWAVGPGADVLVEREALSHGIAYLERRSR